MSAAVKDRIPPAEIKTASPVVHWPQLDGFRTLCVMMAFVIHAWIGPVTKPSPMGVLGYYGVDCFFALSAFLITSMLIREKASFGNIHYRHFVVRRGLRIWPLFYTVLLLACVFLPLMNAPAAMPHYLQFALHQFIPAAFFYFNFSFPFNYVALGDFSRAIGIPIAAAMVPFWTLCIEEHFYTVWPLVLKHVRTLSHLAVGICVAEVLTVLGRCLMNWVAFNLVAVNIPFQMYFMNTFCHLDPLLAGALLAIAYHQKPKLFDCGNKYGIPLCLLLVASLAYLFTNLHQHFPKSDPMTIFDLTVTGFTSGLSLYLVMAWSPLRKFFARKEMAIVGRYSFAIYMLHNLVFALLENLFALAPLPDVQMSYFVLKSIIGFPITYALAAFSWKYLEGPCQRYKKRYERRAINPV